MNQAFFEYASNIIDNLTNEEIFNGLVKAGIEPSSITIRQLPEQPKAEPYRHPFIGPYSHDE